MLGGVLLSFADAGIIRDCPGTPCMRSITRHFIATLVCITVFTLGGTGDGFLRVLQTMPNANPGVSLLLTGAFNFVFVSALSMVVLTPVASIADHIFKRKWPFRFFIQVPLLVPFLFTYLLMWTLVFGGHFLRLLIPGTRELILPLMLYWAVYRGLDRDFGS